MRKIHEHVPLLFKPEAWKITEDRFSRESNKTNETIFALANGYLGVRGTFEEGFNGPQGLTNPGTFINGVYEYHDYHHIWCRPGFPERYHSIVNQVEAFETKILIDGEQVVLDAEKVSDYCRILNMRKGVLTRSFRYTTEKGKEVSLQFERFVSLSNKHLAAMRVTVRPLSDCELIIDSILDGNIKKIDISDGEKGIFLDDCFEFLGVHKNQGIASVLNRTKVSGFTIATSMLDSVNGNRGSMSLSGKTCREHYQFAAKKDTAYTLERVTGYGTNRDFEDPESETEAITRHAFQKGYSVLKKEHEEQWEKFWKDLNLEIEGDDCILQGVRFAMFHLYQSAGRDGKTNISANGLTGIGYSGHTFWDTEIFMMPMFQYTQPELARQLLIYRYNILDKARERAAQMDDKGALFAWNSINGEECGHVFEAATAQYHINPDIYYAIDRYVQATGDEQFLVDYGAEILFEISKCMAHRGSFIPLKQNRFCINVVCGPDEYTPAVDNNCYTNWLCKRQLKYTLKVGKMLKKKHPDVYQRLQKKCGIDDEELSLWKRAAQNMYIPYNRKLGIYMQDDQFLYRDPIDIDKISVDKLPLLTHLHPLNLWRYQVAKQADLVLLTYLCSEDFTPEMKRRIFDYYEPRTIHDSSLSAGIHSIVACDIGKAGEAYGYFRQAARMDLDNVNRNTYLGVHSACMGNTWQILTGGFAGMRLYGGKLHFRPILPHEWNRYGFNIRYRNCRIHVDVQTDKTVYTLLEGSSVSFFDHGIEIKLDDTKKDVEILRNVGN